MVDSVESLESFARAASPTKQCVVCRLPEALREQVTAARAKDAPISYLTISEWLETREHPVSHESIRKHFRRGHS